jgi:gliding motility-associated-like protein
VVNRPDASFSLAEGDSVCQSQLAIALLPTQPGGVFSGEWVSGNSFTPISAGTYSIKYVLNLGACADSLTRTIVVKPLPNPGFSGLPATVCLKQNPITLIPVNQGGIFTGNHVSGEIFTPSQVGATQVTYSVIQAGCEASETQTVQVLPLPDATFSGLPDEICSNAERITLFPTVEGGTFTGEGIASGSFTPALEPGIYQIIYTLSLNNCSNADTQQVVVKTSPVIAVAQNIFSISPGQSTEPFQITVSGTNDYQVAWSPATSLSNANVLSPVANPDESTRYLLTITANGCTDTASVLVNVSGGLIIPKAFTPNNDGDNDTWVIAGLSAFGSHRISVFNRWGSQVFESTAYQNNWGAARLPAGTYYYVLELDGEKRSGTVMVIR